MVLNESHFTLDYLFAFFTTDRKWKIRYDISTKVTQTNKCNDAGQAHVNIDFFTIKLKRKKLRKANSFSKFMSSLNHLEPIESLVNVLKISENFMQEKPFR